MTDGYMPTIEQYMALARALHDENDLCNANYVLSFDDCDLRESDIADAVKLLVALHRDDWTLVRQPAGVTPMQLAWRGYWR